ncbi:hypothetical protein OXYTRIMIC_452 [Oxytricha trifallax]|uniref:FAR1 domain-containing protein n=1 Tax=Oxytricha trifallax TaxID=1172189 RepID=A0A073HYR2_9SPIT|nr:hypothetical protein OXYTRIMIC_452 [Oxytricha trifallax]
MHNHILSENHQIMPFPVKYKARPKYKTPDFEQFNLVQGNGALELRQNLTQMCFERGFLIKQIMNNETKGIQSLSFQCKYQIQANSERELGKEMDLNKGYTFRCPFKLNYHLQKDSNNVYLLNKFEDRHMHPLKLQTQGF